MICVVCMQETTEPHPVCLAELELARRLSAGCDHRAAKGTCVHCGALQPSPDLDLETPWEPPVRVPSWRRGPCAWRDTVDSPKCGLPSTGFGLCDKHRERVATVKIRGPAEGA